MRYPELALAPLKVKIKAQSFGVHDYCASAPESSCETCPHLIKMAYDCYYGHIADHAVAMRRIGLDLSEESRKG